MSLTFLYKSYDYSRLILFFSWFFMVILGNLFRQLACRLRSWLYKKELGVRQAVLWGKSENMDFLKSRISANSGSGLFIIENAENKSLLSLVSEVAIDELFVVAEDINYEEIWQLREASANPGMRLHLVPSLGKMYLRNLQGLFFDGTVLVSLGSMRDKRMHLFAKRIFDLAIALPALIVFSPLFLLLALLVKLDSAGSVLFAQKRVGLNERQFTMYKFRTMFKDANAYAETPRDKADDRITRVGRFLRSTGLDELPQLFNVLGGSMSIVGPRPEMPFIVEKYSELERQRLQAKPGITGLWQVYARCENLPIHHHIEYDLYYIENFSLVLDVIIILDTIPTAFLHTGI
jgi:exopolysaccharide biosynthesis polyprenyl glycosylphosphotransferase